MPADSLLRSPNNSICHAGIIWVNFESNRFDIFAKFAVIQNGWLNHSIECSTHHNIQYRLSIFVYHIVTVLFIIHLCKDCNECSSNLHGDSFSYNCFFHFGLHESIRNVTRHHISVLFRINDARDKNRLCHDGGACGLISIHVLSLSAAVGTKTGLDTTVSLFYHEQ